jgi:hypothetical protein|tara:strand:+ start:928 stop:1872 length:945 start_codon:yes stop_codon:yes gene_type:complete
MNNLLDKLTYHKRKYEIFGLLENLYKSISLSKLKKTKIKTHNLDSYSNLKSNNSDVVMFYSKVTKPTIIHYQDIANSFDLNDLNYDEILDVNLNYLLRSNKVNKIFLFSNISVDKINNKKLVLIKIDINNDKLMYERALTMFSFVNSNLFKNNTCFIDTDVFINFDELNIFSKNFDIALTHRTKQTLMPINEGVILVKKNGNSNAKEFFRDYMNIYSFISKSNYVKDFYGNDIHIWRGGQLSLNLLVYNKGSIFEDYENFYVDKNLILILPSFNYNFTPKSKKNYSINYLKKKSIVHYKGTIKKSFNNVKSIYF